MYNTLMLVLTNFVQVLTALTNFVLVLTAHTYHSYDVLVPNKLLPILGLQMLISTTLINPEKVIDATTLKVEKVEATILFIFKVKDNTINHRAILSVFPSILFLKATMSNLWQNGSFAHRLLSQNRLGFLRQASTNKIGSNGS